ncbi:LPS translocon maturation chaperone LptM [Undibacterium sp. TJN25]|uniref:LPS translocon maturation chaperone LptM n=1 Tax=Undibacterium sp. TJN25 TaxID=3413056 RepID=UPI003BF10BBA
MLHSTALIKPPFYTVFAILKTHTLIPTAAALILALGSLSACGQKGPLYMPKKPAGITANKPVQPATTSSNVPADVSVPVKSVPPPDAAKDAGKEN